MHQKRNNKPPLVSVVIPTYNRGWAICDAIESVLLQDFKDFELIIIDDGSTDDTRQRIASCAPQISVIHQNNQGVSAARNRGIKMAAGQFIAFLDSDDSWMPQKLTQQLAFFDSMPEALICQTEEIWIRKGIRVNPAKKHKKQSGMIFEPSLRLCLVSPSAVMMRKELFHKVGLFDESLPACEDYDLWLRTSLEYPIYLVDIPLIRKHGGHSDQLSSRHSLDKYRIQSLLKLIKGRKLSEGRLKQALTVLVEKCDIYAAGCIKHHRYAEAQFYKDLAVAHRGKI